MVSTASLPMRRIGLALAAGVVLFSALAVAQDAISVGELSAGEIEDELQVSLSIFRGSRRLSNLAIPS